MIWKLYVHPAFRSRGIGPRLISAAEATAPAGTERVHLEHIAGNTAAARFYEREGFTVTGVDPHPTGHPGRATVWRVRAAGERRGSSKHARS